MSNKNLIEKLNYLWIQVEFVFLGTTAISNLKTTVMVKEKEGKEKTSKKEPLKNLKEKRADKAAKKANRSKL